MKKSLFMVLSIVAIFQFGTIANASVNQDNLIANQSAGISVRAEVREWKVRYLNGQLQRRLWSVTYGHWIGEWENF